MRICKCPSHPDGHQLDKCTVCGDEYDVVMMGQYVPAGYCTTPCAIKGEILSLNGRDAEDFREWQKFLKERESASTNRYAAERHSEEIVRVDVPPGLIEKWGRAAEKVAPVCECGAEKCKTTHASWCPIYK